MFIKALSITAINNVKERFRFHQDVQKIINGGISFGIPPASKVNNAGQNIDGQWVTVADTGLANTQFSVPVSLYDQNHQPRIAVGFDVKRINVAGVIFDSGTAWTTKAIFLKCNVAHASVTLFVH